MTICFLSNINSYLIDPPFTQPIFRFSLFIAYLFTFLLLISCLYLSVLLIFLLFHSFCMPLCHRQGLEKRRCYSRRIGEIREEKLQDLLRLELLFQAVRLDTHADSAFLCTSTQLLPAVAWNPLSPFYECHETPHSFSHSHVLSRFSAPLIRLHRFL